MSENNKIYEKLTPQRKALVDAILAALEKDDKKWLQGWAAAGAPKSAISGKSYNGVNRLMLTAAAMQKGYTDNRWLTYKQMEEKGWHFKTDGEGVSLGKGAGVAIEYYELRDRETKRPFDRHVLDGMTADEKNEYMDENVYPLRKYYRVFNAEVIEGIPASEKREIDPTDYNERAEKLLQLWSDTESKIIYGGSEAFYRPATDEIHLPKREQFVDLPEYYSTALHEVGHSTGHEKRLNRDLSGKKNTPEYAEEELRAEIASMFMEQDFGVAVQEKHIENNGAYIQSWHERIKEDPNVLFRAIADAEKITKYITAKEREIRKEVEPFTVIEDTDEYGEPVYKVLMCAEYGQTRYALSGYPFRSRDALMTEFGKMQELPFWKDNEFQEVSKDALENMSRERAKAQTEKEERLSEVEEEKSEVFLPPSEVATIIDTPISVTDMGGRGIESLTRLDDREVFEQASKTTQGEKFLSLFNGKNVLGSERDNERSLMARLAIHTGGNEEQLLRIFRASGQFREDKPNGYYEKMAKEEIKFIESMRGSTNVPSAMPGGKGGRYANAKT